MTIQEINKKIDDIYVKYQEALKERIDFLNARENSPIGKYYKFELANDNNFIMHVKDAHYDDLDNISNYIGILMRLDGSGYNNDFAFYGTDYIENAVEISKEEYTKLFNQAKNKMEL